jgi:hypothetical protein
MSSTSSQSACKDSLVVVPTYNEAENVERLIESILVQGAFDVLIVDDHSLIDLQSGWLFYTASENWAWAPRIVPALAVR